ncbi:MAG: methylated-DNA--[protein]-cysteine S-methyltransferase [Myxococcales bacterium]|nr:methylated-DNA--[protein]-cysteine S-methyltransferase [Myxococcales bacterium]
MIRHTTFDSPLGPIRVEATPQGLRRISLLDGVGVEDPPPGAEAGTLPVIEEAIRQLRAYFDGGRTHFELPVDVPGTDFQQQVWQALTEIPFGETRSYGEVAQAIGKPKAVRAVGAANGRNPLPIVVPCHRVIGADGSLTGFRGGVELKRRLLGHEGWRARLGS